MDEIIDVVIAEILNPLVLLMFGLATLVFFWGLYKYLSGAYDANDHKEGVNNIIWGLAGMAIMISVYGIIEFIKSTFSL